MRQHTNAFDFIRLLAAGMVLWSHQHALMGFPEPLVTILHTSIGGLGVLIFFAISGYLNTMSVFRHRSVLIFLFNRALRIYPALAVCVFFSAAVGLCVTPNVLTYFSPQLISFIAKDITLFFGVQAGVPAEAAFATNVFPGALNGSLWTLPYEVKMYVGLALFLCACRYSPLGPIIVFSCAVVAALLPIFGLPAPPDYQPLWLQFSIFFLAGSALAAAKMLISLPWTIGAMIVVSSLLAACGLHYLFFELLVTAIVIAIGSTKLPRGAPLDLSYGIYLYAFPVQQLSAMLFADFWQALMFSVIFTVMLAGLSAVFIERPALRARRIVRFPPLYAFDGGDKSAIAIAMDTDV